MICVPCPAPLVSGHPGGGVARVDIAELYRTWGPAIYRRCLRLLRDTEAARDATQEAFRKALSSPEKLDDPELALPFIYRVATNHCLNERRNAGRDGAGRPGRGLGAPAVSPTPARPAGAFAVRRQDAVHRDRRAGRRN